MGVTLPVLGATAPCQRRLGIGCLSWCFRRRKGTVRQRGAAARGERSSKSDEEGDAPHACGAHALLPRFTGWFASRCLPSGALYSGRLKLQFDVIPNPLSWVGTWELLDIRRLRERRLGRAARGRKVHAAGLPSRHFSKFRAWLHGN